MSSILPKIAVKHSVAIICEGLEERKYLSRLIELNIWNPIYTFHLFNVCGEGNIFGRYMDLYQNDNYDIVLAFCDTDRMLSESYRTLKEKINKQFNKKDAAGKVIIFANPSTMQIILSHFGDVSLSTHSKKQNELLIAKLTGIRNYAAHKNQIESICKKIDKSSYNKMRSRVEKIDKPENNTPSTNFIKFLKLFERNDTQWINSTNKFLNSSNS